jgi:hypothetical protein
MMVGVRRSCQRTAGRAADEVVPVLGPEGGDEVGMHAWLLSAFFSTACRMSCDGCLHIGQKELISRRQALLAYADALPL